MIITFCGHRSFSANDEMKVRLLALVEGAAKGAEVSFYLGGYGAFDEFAYLCCKEYQEAHPKARLIFVTPYITEEYQKNHLATQKTRYDEILYPAIENRPLRFAITYRNRWMVENADLTIACITHNYGGAYQTYRHAKRKGKNVINLAENGV